MSSLCCINSNVADKYLLSRRLCWMKSSVAAHQHDLTNTTKKLPSVISALYNISSQREISDILPSVISAPSENPRYKERIRDFVRKNTRVKIIRVFCVTP